MCQDYLADQRLHRLLEKVDLDLAQKAKEKGCCRCGDTLYPDNYSRKPRGGPAHWDKRLSFTCAHKRHRVTPPSVRFLGRKVYVGFVLILVSAMNHGLKPQRVEPLREMLGIDRRTLQHWRQWWLESFVQTPFWKSARARFMPGIVENKLPLSLCEAFQFDQRERLVELLRFLAPITTQSVPMAQLI